jgi:hypothetical protein
LHKHFEFLSSRLLLWLGRGHEARIITPDCKACERAFDRDTEIANGTETEIQAGE